MARKTSSANPMAAPDRRTFLQKATAALGFLPLAGCALNSEGIPNGRPTPANPPFEGPPVTLTIESLRPAAGTPLENYTLGVTFEAIVTGVGFRTHTQDFKNYELQPLPFVANDPNIIAFNESGSVLCKCKFMYAAPPDNPDAEPLPELIEAPPHQKLANQVLPQFNLSFVDPGYQLV